MKREYPPLYRESRAEARRLGELAKWKESRVEKNELLQQLSEKVDAAWDAYVDGLLKLTPGELIEQAEEIAATRLCRDQLKSGGFPDHHLEHLLQFDDPLMTMREQWTAEPTDHHDAFEYTLWALWDHGPAPGDAPDQTGMEMR